MKDGRTPPSDERLVILALSTIVVICLVGIIIEDALRVAGGSDALLTIGSLAAGALASRISQKTPPPEKATTDVQVKSQVPSSEDDFAVIGRAATKSIIAEAMRQMGGTPQDRDGDRPG